MFEGKPLAKTIKADDRRTAKRHMSVFLLAKVTAAEQQALGRVLNLSQSGAKVETRLTLALGDTLLLEIRSDLKVAGTVRWTGGRTFGVQFDREVDVGRFLSREVPRLHRVKPRAPRYVCEADATVAGETATTILKVRDVSLSGAGLAGEAALAPGDDVLVTIFGLRPRRAKVIWSNDQGIGITFLKPLDFRDFETWLDDQVAKPRSAKAGS
jgi:hypothetical protein